MTYPDGRIEEGQFKDNKLLSNKSEEILKFVDSESEKGEESDQDRDKKD